MSKKGKSNNSKPLRASFGKKSKSGRSHLKPGHTTKTQSEKE